MRKTPFLLISQDGRWFEIGLETKAFGYLKLFKDNDATIGVAMQEVEQASRELGIPFYFFTANSFESVKKAGWQPNPNMDYFGGGS